MAQRNDMLKQEREALEWKGILSKQRSRDTTMSTGPQSTSTNEGKEMSRIEKDMNKGIK